MGGILTGWFTPTEAGMIATVYILVVIIPFLRPEHIRKLPGDFVYTGMLYAIPLSAVAAASAFGWMLAYLRGPDVVAGYIQQWAGTDPKMIMFLLVVLFVIVGDFIDAVPGDHHLHADHQQADRDRQHQPRAHGRGDHHDAGVRADHAALRAVAAGGVEVHRGAVRARARVLHAPGTSPRRSSPRRARSKASASRSRCSSPTSRARWSCSPTATPRRRARSSTPCSSA